MQSKSATGLWTSWSPQHDGPRGRAGPRGQAQVLSGFTLLSDSPDLFRGLFMCRPLGADALRILEGQCRGVCIEQDAQGPQGRPLAVATNLDEVYRVSGPWVAILVLLAGGAGHHAGARRLGGIDLTNKLGGRGGSGAASRLSCPRTKSRRSGFGP
jgi:hypothetical protein